GYSVVEGLVASGRFREAGDISSLWLDMVRSRFDLQSIKRFVREDVSRKDPLSIVKVSDCALERRDLIPEARLQIEAARCLYLGTCQELCEKRQSYKSPRIKAQVGWIDYCVGANRVNTLLLECKVRAKRAFDALVNPNEAQISIASRLGLTCSEIRD